MQKCYARFMQINAKFMQINAKYFLNVKTSSVNICKKKCANSFKIFSANLRRKKVSTNLCMPEHRPWRRQGRVKAHSQFQGWALQYIHRNIRNFAISTSILQYLPLYPSPISHSILLYCYNLKDALHLKMSHCKDRWATC